MADLSSYDTERAKRQFLASVFLGILLLTWFAELPTSPKMGAFVWLVTLGAEMWFGLYRVLTQRYPLLSFNLHVLWLSAMAKLQLFNLPSVRNPTKRVTVNRHW